MPLYNQQTNLQGQGRFSPGVTYYAGIRAPVPAAPRIEKGQYSFNVDLKPLADAYIGSQELEAKKYEAEADRAFRQGLADQEDKRYRDLEALRDAREREFHADTVDYQNKSLEINQFKALADYDLGLRQLLRDQEKDKREKSENNDKKLANSLMNEADIFIRKAYLRTQQDPSYTREIAQDDVYNYITNLQSNYPEYIDQSKLAETTSRYTFGFGGAKKAAEDSQEKQAGAWESGFQTALDYAPGLKNRPDQVARRIYQDVTTQVDSYSKYKSMLGNPYISEDQRRAAFTEMQKSGVNMARLGILNRIYNFASQPMNARDYTNYSSLESTLRNETIASLSTMMEYKDAVDYYDIAKERLGVNTFLESYNTMHKTNADVADNLATDMLNTEGNEYLYTLPQWRSYRALGGNVNTLIQTDPRFALNLGQEVLGIVKANQVQFDDKTQTYSYLNKSYSVGDIVAAEKFFGTNNPWAAAMLSAITESKNMPSLVEQGLAEEKDVNEAMNAEFSLLTYPGQISTLEDTTILSNDLKSSSFRENLLWCRNRAGTKEGTRFCVNAIGLEEQLDDSILSNYALALANTKSTFGNVDAIGIKLTQGNGVELGFIDDNIDISDDNFKVLNRYVDRVNSKHSNVAQESKISYLRLFDGLENIKVLDSSYTGPFITQPNIGQQAVGKVFETDKKISQGYSELSNKVFGTEEERVKKELDKELKQLNKEKTNNEGEVKSNAINMLTNEAAYIKSAKGWEDKEIDGINYSRLVKDGVLHIQIGNDSFSFYYPLDISEEELVADLKNNPKETVTSLSGSWSRKL